MATKREQFLELFRARMKPGSPEGGLDRFIDALSLGDLRECLSAYFDEDKYYVRERRRSVTVFLRLAARAAAKNEYYALHVGAMVRLPRSPWQLRYAELSPAEKDALQKVIKAQKRRLPRHQQTFIDKFTSFMTDRKVTQQKIQQFTDDLNADDLRGCLFAYIEVSQGFEKGNGESSLLVFRGLSSLALHKGGFYFAHEYEGNIGAAGTVWHLRFTSLDPYFQQELRREIEQAKVLRSDVTVKDQRGQDKTYKDVPIGKGRVDVTPTAQVHHEDAPRTSFSRVQLAFIGLYRRYVDSQGSDARRKAMNAFQEFLRVHKSFDEIRSCVLAYLEDSVRHYGEKQSHDSLVIFFGVLSDALTKGTAYYAFKVKALIHTPDSIWNKRYLALDKAQYRDRLDAQIEDELRRKARLIDDVKAVYFSKHRSDPDLKALREFAPVSAPDQIGQLSNALSDVEVASNVSNLESLAAAFDAVAAVLRAQKDLLTLAVLVMHCRSRRTLGPRFRHLVYLCGVGMLFVAALKKYPERYYRRGFNEEETQWLLGGEGSDDRYYEDFAARLQHLLWKGTDADSIVRMAKGEAVLQAYSDRLRLHLTPPIEATAVRGAVETAWKKRWAAVSAIRIPVEGHMTGRQEIRVGQTIGRFFVLWWDEKNETVYLETEGLDGALFHTGRARLGQIYADDSFYGTVARNTEHLLTLIPFFFEILSFIPDLVSGGLTGLVKAVVVGYAFEYSIKALGIDPNIAQLVMLGAPLLAHGVRPKAAPRVHPQVDAPGVAGVHVDARPKAQRAPGTDARLVDAPGTSQVHGATTSPLGTPGADVRLTQTRDVLLSNRTGADAPKAGGGGAGKPPRGDDAPPPPGDGPPRKPKDPHQKDPALVSREGIDMRGVTLDDARIGVGLHQDAAVTARMPGDWTLEGTLPINENGFRLRGPNRAQAPLHGGTYERAFNEQVVESMAERISSKAVRVDERKQKKGWKTPSSSVTSRLKLQARKAYERFKRQPDASMEIVEKVGGKNVVTEAHLFEATTNPNFWTTVGKAGHKQQQVTGTAWILSNNPRKGYTSDTKVVYHIVAPARPAPESVAFLQKLMKDNPKLEILWYVVR